MVVEDEDEDDMAGRYLPSSQLTLHVLAPAARSRIVATPKRSSNPSLVKLKGFFEELINVNAPTPEDATELPARPPRIIYIRDFPTLAPSSVTWYPALLAAVRSRRQGPIARATSPVLYPTTIIFGITPSIVAPASESPMSDGPPQSLINLLMSRQNVAQGVSGARSAKADYGEDESAEKARERRLRERLKRWERGDHSLQDEIPRLLHPTEGEDNGPGGDPNVVLFGDGGGPFSGLTPMVASAFRGRLGGQSNNSPTEGERSSRFFRSSVIVPRTRSALLEKSCRMDRRREINELTMRMGVAGVGGTLDKMAPAPDEPASEDEPSVAKDPAGRRMWEDWGRSVELWSNVRQIADRAVGKVIASNAKKASSGGKSSKASLDPTPVEWEAVFEAWMVHKAARDMRKAWVQQSSGKSAHEHDEDADEKQQQAEHSTLR